MTTASPTTSTPVGRVVTLAATELRLALRNRTVAISSIVVPLGLGLFWAFTFAGADDAMAAMAVSLQLTMVLAMGIYVTATQTVVARRQARVLKRMRTTGLSDAGLLTATVAPAVVLGLGQLVVFALIDMTAGLPLPAAPVWLLVAVIGGVALAGTAALATAVVTASPERAQITTLPFTLLLLAAALVIPVLPSDGPWIVLVAIPGAAVGALVQAAQTGEMWGTGVLGGPAVLLPVLALLVWPLVFARFARTRFRWDPRH